MVASNVADNADIPGLHLHMFKGVNGLGENDARKFLMQCSPAYGKRCYQSRNFSSRVNLPDCPYDSNNSVRHCHLTVDDIPDSERINLSPRNVVLLPMPDQSIAHLVRALGRKASVSEEFGP